MKRVVNGRFLLRELLYSKKQAAIYILCVALSLVSVIAVNSFRRDIDRSISGDALALHGGDIILHSHYDLSEGLQRAVVELTEEKKATAVRTWAFYSVARKSDESGSLLCNIKVVENGYPLYGRVDLASGREFSQVLGAGKIVVGQGVLDRLGIAVGDQLQIGKSLFEIADVILYESAKPVRFFNIGPPVLVSYKDLAGMDLVKQGSRIAYETLLKMADATAVDTVAAQLRERGLVGQERVETFRDAGSGIKHFFDNLLFFLSLISICTLLLAGTGIESSLSAILRLKENNFAIIRSFGATGAYLLRHYLLFVLILSAVGTALGIVAGLLVKGYLSVLFSDFLPQDIAFRASIADLSEGVVIGLMVVLFFTFLPLWRINNIKPVVIFRSESFRVKKTFSYYLCIVLGFSGLCVLLIRYLGEVSTGVYFLGGILLLLLLATLMTRLTLYFLSKIKWRRPEARLAMRSLLRPGNVTQSIVVTLAIPLSLLLFIYLVESNLRATYIDSFPADAPTLFCLDIQKNQQEAFRELVGDKVTLHPVIRARLISINGKAVNRGRELKKRRDNLAREFNLTYRDVLLEDEILLAGKRLFRKDEKGEPVLQVSLLDTVAEMGDMKLGDILQFNIQGVKMEVEVTSIRSRTRSMLYPFFYFIFPEKYLKEAPQTYFAALHVESEEIPLLENRIVQGFPNISTINIAEAAKEMGRMMQKLSKIVNFFAAFSILAGGLIIVSSILATRFERIKEAVYYKILGADSRFVLRIFFFENLLLGLLSSVFAIVMAQVAAWSLCHFFLGISYVPGWAACLGLVGLTIFFVVILGLLGSIPAMKKKPGRFLRQLN